MDELFPAVLTKTAGTPLAIYQNKPYRKFGIRMAIDNLEKAISKTDIQSTSVATAPRVRKFFSKRVVAYLIKLIIAAMVTVFLIKRVHGKEIISAFASASLPLIFISLLLLIPNLYLQFFKWRYLVRLLKAKVSNQEIMQSLFAGFTFGFITPGRLGEFGRAFFIKETSWISLLGIAAIDKLFSLAIVVFWGAVGLIFFIARQLTLYIFVPLFVFILIALFVIYYILLHPQIIKSFLYSINIILPFRDKIKLLMGSLDNFHQPQARKLLWLNLCFFIAFLLQYCLLTFAFEPSHFLPTFFALSAVMLVKTMLPISVGDLGIRESAAVFFLGKIGIMEATAFNASILLFIINLVIPSLMGLILLLKYRLIFLKNKNSLK